MRSAVPLQTGDITDATPAVPGLVVGVDELHAERGCICTEELDRHVCQKNGLHAALAHEHGAVLAVEQTHNLASELRP